MKKQTSPLPADLGVIDQVRKSMLKTNRLATACGFVLGGFVPVASYVVCHSEAPANPAMWVLVAGGLGYSALTVFQWAKIAFKHPAKALGFVVLIEGVMTFSVTQWLGITSLALLVIINGIATGCALALDQKTKRNG